MLFKKKTRFEIADGLIKEEITDGNVALVRLNIKYPDIKCKERDPLSHNAVGFYKRVAENLAYYAKSDLLAAARTERTKNADTFMPYSVCMRYGVTYLSDEYLSILLEISVSDGAGIPMTEKKAQVWERKFGTKCKPTYFMSKAELDKRISDILPSEYKSRPCTDNFILRERGYEFFIENGKSIVLKYEEADEKNLLKIT